MKTQSSHDIREIFKAYTGIVETSLREILDTQEDLSLYRHMEYFMGFRDEALQTVETYAGKRFRSSMCLMLADWYGCKQEGIPVATSLELFHNFTLIHDDIVDGDTFRRGRPTVWKLFGHDHAINDGDGQLILAMKVVADASALSDALKGSLQSFLLQQYLRVVEGQHMDFELTSAQLGDALVTKERYLKMVGRKTADLIAAATHSAGMLSKQSTAECEHLYTYGYQLGVAYQLCDDVVSIWGTQAQTGKRLYGDLLEKKKTLPVLHLLEVGDTQTGKTLLDLYNSDTKLTIDDAQPLIELLEKEHVYEYMHEQIQLSAEKAKSAAVQLSCTETQKQTLVDIVDQLLPDIKKI